MQAGGELWPTAYGLSQIRYLEHPAHPMQFTTGRYSWSSGQQRQKPTLVANGISWPPGTNRQQAQQQIQQALQQAGLQVSAGSIFVPKLPGSRNAASDTALVTFTSSEEADKVRTGSTPVVLPVYQRGGQGHQQGLPIWLIHPGDMAISPGDSKDSAVHVNGAAFAGRTASEVNIIMMEAWQAVYSTAVLGAQQQGKAIDQQELQQLQHLQFYPAQTLKVADDTFRVTFSSPVAATSLIQLGHCTLSSGHTFSFSKPHRVQVCGQQVMLLASYVGKLLAGFRQISEYQLGGKRVPSQDELQQITQLLESSLGRLPQPAVQLVPLTRKPAGQAAHLLVRVPTAAMAKKLVKEGISLPNGNFLRFEQPKLTQKTKQ